LPLLLGSLALATPALAAPATNPLVLELFTSQGCSSCPPADALLGELAHDRRDLLPLDLHVTYWDRLGWRDPYSLPQATQRQEAYAPLLGEQEIYTPQLIAGGRYQAVGSDREGVLAAIMAARLDAAASRVTLGLRPLPAGTVEISIGPGAGAASLLLVGFDPSHTTAVGRGENSGRTLTEVNVVRGISRAASYSGAPLQLTAPRPPGEQVAALLQQSDGRILAAAVLN
jgi:hypothetical protein